VIFSVGVAIGSMSVNALLKGTVSARYSPVSVVVMALFVVGFYTVCQVWPRPVDGALLDVNSFIAQPLAIPLLLSLLGIATAGGMFVVPLYAFLPPSSTRPRRPEPSPRTTSSIRGRWSSVR
jgi:hypothetical protein